MVRHPPRPGRTLSVTAFGAATLGVRLLICAELPPDVFAWADALRRRHYPPNRNRLGAHVTLFHGLPPSARSAADALLGDMVRRPAPKATITGLMDLDRRGTAFVVASDDMIALHAEMAERLHGLIQQKDSAAPRFHITIQNKVPTAEARALQDELSHDFRPRSFRFHGLGLYGWRDELWHKIRLFRFRG